MPGPKDFIAMVARMAAREAIQPTAIINTEKSKPTTEAVQGVVLSVDQDNDTVVVDLIDGRRVTVAIGNRWFAPKDPCVVYGGKAH